MGECAVSRFCGVQTATVCAWTTRWALKASWRGRGSSPLAMAAPAGDDQSQFAFNADIAVEHLAKAD
jgi:hypothetical protein